MQKATEVRTYFTDRARLFDALYEDGGLWKRGFNRLFRRPMFVRYAYTLSALGSLEGQRLLDVGCGAGRYAVELARRGAHVVGIDFSDEMLGIARQRAAASGVEDRVEFVSADFTRWAADSSERFDASFAMGVLDYVEDAPKFIAMMAKVSDEVIASFPTPTPIRMPLRKIRYGLRGCPVHFYWRGEIERMYEQAGLSEVEVRRLGFSGFWVRGKNARTE